MVAASAEQGLGGMGGKKSLCVTLNKLLHADNQVYNKYFTTFWIFIKLNVLKFAEKNYFCDGKIRS